MSDLNNIEKLFQDKLQNLEMPVRPELWNKVSVGAGIGKTSFWSASKIAAASLVGVVAISALTWFVFQDEKSEDIPQHSQVEPTAQNNEPVVPSDRIETPEQNVQESYNRQEELLAPTTAPAETNSPSQHEFTSSLQGIPESNTSLDDLEPMSIEIPEAPSTHEQVQTYEQPAEAFEPAPQEVLNLELIAPVKYEEQSLEQIHFPQQFVQVFNPNLPGENGQFTVYSENLGSFKIEIKTRAGKLVFTSSDPNFVWRGEQMDGSQAPEGTYMYTIFSTTMNGESIKRAGSVFLMRK